MNDANKATAANTPLGTKELTYRETYDMQAALQEKYHEQWGGLSPEHGAHSLLWMYGEAGEVGDIIKKCGDSAIMDDAETRAHFIEEMCDVMMYFHDVLLCYDISPEEFAAAYRAKFERNMKRW